MTVNLDKLLGIIAAQESIIASLEKKNKDLSASCDRLEKKSETLSTHIVSFRALFADCKNENEQLKAHIVNFRARLLKIKESL